MAIANATPVTVVTGFLGSGKTTLINRLLTGTHGRRFAVIENEYGEVGIDAELLVREGGETVVQLANGCVCCSVRGDLANALHGLAQRRAAGEIAFDHVLIEPTGLADPGPVMRTFLAETELLSQFFLDGVVTLFDALHGESTLAQSAEAAAQLACADRLLVTKIDLLHAEDCDESALLARLQTANAAATVQAIDLTRADWDEFFESLTDLRGYQFDRLPPLPSHDHDHAPHTPGVGTVTFEADAPLDGTRLNAALSAITTRYGDTLWRLKGVLAIDGMRARVVLQGVQGLIQANPATVWRPYEPRRSQLVLIGRDLDRAWILAQLETALRR